MWILVEAGNIQWSRVMEKILVAYFSASGVTKKVAEAIANDKGADIFEIKPTVPYSDANLDWRNPHSRSSLEMKDESSRPEIERPIDITPYGTIYLGFPIWWYVEPRIIDSFLDGIDLEGKTIIPFATSGGSDIGGSEKRLQALYPEAKWLKGKRIRSIMDIDKL